MANKGTKIKKLSQLNQLLNSPIRYLSKVKDLYDAQMGGYGGWAFGCTAYCPTVLPRSFSVSSNNKSHDTKSEKVGLRRMMTSDELERRTRCSPVMAGGAKGAVSVMARSYSVGVVRIDEDEVCEFGEDVMVKTRSCVDPARMMKRLAAH